MFYTEIKQRNFLQHLGHSQEKPGPRPARSEKIRAGPRPTNWKTLESCRRSKCKRKEFTASGKRQRLIFAINNIDNNFHKKLIVDESYLNVEWRRVTNVNICKNIFI